MSDLRERVARWNAQREHHVAIVRVGGLIEAGDDLASALLALLEGQEPVGYVVVRERKGERMKLEPEALEALLSGGPMRESVLRYTVEPVGAHPTGEPVAWLVRFHDGSRHAYTDEARALAHATPPGRPQNVITALYAHPTTGRAPGERIEGIAVGSPNEPHVWSFFRHDAEPHGPNERAATLIIHTPSLDQEKD